MTDTAALRAAALAATPGPWGNEPPSRERAMIHHIIRERLTGPQVANVLLDEDAAYIALASPDRILAICDENKELRAALTDLVKWASRSVAGKIEDRVALLASVDEARAALEGKTTE